MNDGELRGLFGSEEAAFAFARDKVLAEQSSHAIRWDRGAVLPVGPEVATIERDDIPEPKDFYSDID